jgi:hypothetical protein
MIRLIDEQSNRSRWLRLASRRNYWFWIESRRKQSDENDFSNQFDLIRWKNFTFAATIVRLFACRKKKCWSLILSWYMLIFINTDWNKRFKRIESVWVDARLQRCQQTISSRCCFDKSAKNFSSDRHHSSDQSKESISLSIEMSDWESMLKDSRWSDIMIIWDDKMSWWDNESRTNRRTFFSKKNLFDQMIWLSDLINWFLFHHIIIQFFMHERLDFESHLLIWDDSYRQFLHQFVDFESSRFTIIQSKWFIQIEMIFFIFIDFRDRREINEHEDEYAILMKSDRSDNRTRRQLDQKKIISWRSKISILKRISMNHEMRNQ